MDTPLEDQALRAWLDGALTPWFRALDIGNDPTRSFVVMTWERTPTGAVVHDPVYHATYNHHDASGGQPTHQVGASAHARLQVAQHHNTVVEGLTHLLDRLFPMLHLHANEGDLQIGWSEHHLHLLLSFRAYGRHHSACTPARDGQVARSIQELAYEIEHPGCYAIAY